MVEKNLIICLHKGRPESCSEYLRTSTPERFRRLVNNIKLKLLTCLAERSILNVWVGPESASVYEYTAASKLQRNMSYWQ